jgi:SAM-dependent methyltransferase
MSVQQFFDEMSRTYDSDARAIGWDPVALVRDWPFHVAPGARVLDAGCGTGMALAQYAGADRTLAGFDLSDGMLRQARKRGDLRYADLRVASAASPWPYEDGSFDAVLCLAMLEFVEALDESLDELVRVLAPGGRALFTVEDLFDVDGIRRPATELRYGELRLWRRERESVEASLPPGVRMVRTAIWPGYHVDDHGFVCAYRVFEIERPFV